MLQITPHMKVLVAVRAVDFRKGIDGLVALCKSELEQDPFAGTVFVFRNRRANAIKVLLYDGQGFWLCQKRLSEKKFRFWPQSKDDTRLASNPVASLAASELSVLFSAGNPSAVNLAPDWKPL